MKRTLNFALLLMLLIGCGFTANAQVVPANEIRMPAEAAPAPLAGFYKTYLDSTTFQLSCIGPSSINCGPTPKKTFHSSSFADLQTAITAAGANSTIYVDKDYTLTALINTTAANQTLQCVGGAKIIRGFSGSDYIRDNHPGFTLIDCEIDGNRASFTGPGILINTVSGANIINNNIHSHSAEAVYVLGTGISGASAPCCSTGTEIRNNTLSDNLYWNIFGEQGIDGVIVTDNNINSPAVASTGAGGIGFHSTHSVATPLAPTLTKVIGGGTFGNVTVFVQQSVNTPEGPSLKSAEASIALTGCTSNCEITFPCPTLTLPVNSCSGYSATTTSAELLNTSCNAITGTCTITAVGTGAAAPTLDTASNSYIVKNITIARNIIYHGAPAGFCIEVGAFNSNANVANPFHVIFADNQCVIIASTTSGCYESDHIDRWLVHDNTCDVNGFTPAIAGIELVNDYNNDIHDNLINGGTTLPISISINRSKDSLIHDNVVNGGVGTGAGANTGLIAIMQQAAGFPSSRNIVSNNRINMPAGLAALAIRVQCNFAGAACDKNKIINNHIFGQSVASSVGVQIEGDTGTAANNEVAGNTFDSIPVGINIPASGTTTGTLFGPNQFINVTTPVQQASNSTALTSYTGSGGAPSGAWGYTRMTADSSASTSTTLATLAGLSYVVAANTSYTWDCDGYYQASATTGGLALGASGPASPTGVTYSATIATNTTAFDTSAAATAFGTKIGTVVVGAATTNLPFHFHGTLRNGGNSGTVQLQYANTAAGAGSVTVKTDTACRWFQY